MSLISFQNPSALFLLPLAALPLIIHLFRRDKAKVIPFPSVILLASTRTHTWKRSRLQELLLLAARTIIILLLVLLLAGPLVNNILPSWMAARRAAAVIIIDDSASMSTTNNGKSFLTEAREKATELISGLDPDSKVAVISGSIGNKIICGSEEPLRALDKIKSVGQTDFETDLSGAIIKADAILDQAKLSGATITVYSDFRRNCFGSAVLPLPAMKSKSLVEFIKPSGEEPRNNLMWRDVEYYPLKKRIVVQGRASRQTDVSLIVNGRMVYRSRVNPDTIGNFSIGMGWDGTGQAFLECAPDDMPLDDRYYLPSGMTDSVSVLLISQKGDIIFRAFSALFQAGYRIKKTKLPDRNEIDKCDLAVVQTDKIAGILNDLIEAVENGKGLLIIPPEGADKGEYNLLLSRLSRDLTLTGLKEGQADSTGSWGISFGPGHRFEDLSSRDLRHISVRKYWQIKSGLPAEMTINSGMPALLTIGYAKGRAAIWLYGTEPEMTDIGFHPAFLTILNQVCRQLVGPQINGLYAGQNLNMSGLSALISPIGERLKPSPEGSSWPLERTGFYKVVNNTTIYHLGVNMSPEESDLSPVGEKEMEKAMQNNNWSRQSRGIGSVISDLKNILIVLLSLFLLLELVLRSKLKIFLKNPLTTRWKI